MRLYFTFVINILIITHLQQAGCTIPYTETSTIRTEETFKTHLDHFDVWNIKTLELRYFKYTQFYHEGGPLLIEIGSYTTIQDYVIYSHPSYMLAKELHAELILIEHRFYGKSKVSEEVAEVEDEDSSHVKPNDLQFLSVDQALEDLVQFIDYYKRMNPSLKDSKVGVFGCSYAGSLATWLRYKFPHLVDAAWASSAPLRAVLDYYEYYQIVEYIYGNATDRMGPSNCLSALVSAYDKLVECFFNNMGERKNCFSFGDRQEDGSKCDRKDMSDDDILGNIRNIISNPYIRPREAEAWCTFVQYRKIISIHSAIYSSNNCFNRHPMISEDNNGYFRKYQLCTELGYSLTTDNVTLFRLNDGYRKNKRFYSSFKNMNNYAHDPIKGDLKLCQAMLKDLNVSFTRARLERGINRTNRVYGSTTLPVTRVFFIYGTNDPWYKLGRFHSNQNSETPVLFVNGTSHCADMPEFTDSQESTKLIKAKLAGLEFMKRWLK